MTEDESPRECNARMAFYHKKNGLRDDILVQDWSDDKAIRMSGSVVPYLSADKIKKTMAPLFAKNGLELRMEFDELEFREPIGSQMHCTIRLRASTVDIDSGLSDTSTAYGEACDFGDKAVSKAQTYALKNWMMSEFLIADGIDPDTINAITNNGGNYYKKSPEEQEEVKSKVLGQGIPVKEEPKPKAEVPKPKAAPVPKAAPAAKEEAPKPKETPKPKAAPKKAEKPVPEVEEKSSKIVASSKLYTPSGPQGLAIKHIEKVWEERAKAGAVSPEEFNEMSMARATLSSPVDAAKFITKYNVSDTHAHN